MFNSHIVAADCISFAATFYASHQKSLLTHSVAAPPKITPASLGCDFVFLIWRFIYSVANAQKEGTRFCVSLLFGAVCTSPRRLFMRCIKKSSLPRSPALPLRTVNASLVCSSVFQCYYCIQLTHRRCGPHIVRSDFLYFASKMSLLIQALDTRMDFCYSMTERSKMVISSRSVRSGFYRRTE